MTPSKARTAFILGSCRPFRAPAAYRGERRFTSSSSDNDNVPTGSDFHVEEASPSPLPRHLIQSRRPSRERNVNILKSSSGVLSACSEAQDKARPVDSLVDARLLVNIPE